MIKQVAQRLDAALNKENIKNLGLKQRTNSSEKIQTLNDKVLPKKVGKILSQSNAGRPILKIIQ